MTHLVGHECFVDGIMVVSVISRFAGQLKCIKGECQESRSHTHLKLVRLLYGSVQNGSVGKFWL